MKMTNWQITKEKIKNWGILPIDNVPKNIIDFLHNNYSDNPNNAFLAGQIKEEYTYEKWPEFVEEFILKQTTCLLVWTNVLFQMYKMRSGEASTCV